MILCRGPRTQRTASALRCVRGTSASPQQLIEPVAQLVLVIGLGQSRQIELGALRQLGVAGSEQDPIRTACGAGYALDDRFAKAAE